MKYVRLLIMMFLCTGLFNSLVAQEEPTLEGGVYQVSTFAHLLWIAQNSESWDKEFLQTADIDATESAQLDGGAGWSPIGTGVWGGDDYAEVNAFTGVYDGGDFVISNLYINRTSTERQGLFGVVHEPAVIRNVQVLDADITAGHSVGVLVGDNGGAVLNCHASGTMEGTSDVTGGLVGGNAGSITGSSSAVVVIGGSITGGLVGSNWAGTWGEGVILDSYATGTVTAANNNEIGGLVGINDGSISQSYATGAVSGYSYIGGLVGKNAGSISQSYSTGEAVSSFIYSYVGGLVGNNDGGSISQSYATGAVSGSRYLGGLVGYQNSGSISQSYATGAVGGSQYRGGLVGLYNDGSITASFWDIETTGQATSACSATGLTTAQMKDVRSYLEAGWDFQGESVNGTDDVWGWSASENDGYPFLSWQGMELATDLIITTLGAAAVLPTTAVVAGSVILAVEGMDECGFVWNSTGAPQDDDDAQRVAIPCSEAGHFEYELQDLAEATTFYFAAFAHAAGTTVFGDVRTFQTLSSLNMPAGSGTLADAFLISTFEHLLWIAQNPGAWGAVFLQTADIDATESAQLDGGAGWSPIGTGVWGVDDYAEVNAFTGVYDGGDFVISNLFINRTSTERQGLFGVVHEPAVIRNVQVLDADITAGHSVGVLVGDNGGSVLNCHASGTMEGTSDVTGGLVGGNAGSITGSSSAVVVIGTIRTGGLVGSNWETGTIVGSYATGAVSGYRGLGGLVGQNDGSISQSYATGGVNATGWSYSDGVGGLIGTNTGIVSNSFASGNIDGINVVGGLVGINSPGLINQCYATGLVSYQDGYYGMGVRVGGLVAMNEGVIGGSPGEVTASFYDTQTTGQATSSRGLTTAQMKDVRSYLDAGWDFQGESVNGTDGVWGITSIGDSQQKTYPFLSWQGLVHAVAPNVITTSVEYTEGLSADLVGELDFIGQSDVTAYGFCWNTTGAPQHDGDGVYDLGATDVAVAEFTHTLGGLEPAVHYYVRAFAVNADGVAYGEEFDFQTLATEVAPAGSGTEADPYLIANLNHLLWMQNNAGAWGNHYRQTANIDASLTSGWNEGKGWVPLGNREDEFIPQPFSGVYNGNGHIISNLYINDSERDDAGLFGYLTGRVLELGLENVNILAGNNTGAIAGAMAMGFISGSFVNGFVQGEHNVGGIAGQAETSEINNSYVWSGGFAVLDEATNLVTNGDFSDGFSYWTFTRNSPANASRSVSNGVWQFTITSAGDEPYHVQMRQNGILLEQGKSYQLRFDARAAASRTINVYIGDDNDPWNYYMEGVNGVVAVGADWQTITMQFTMSHATNNNTRLAIDVGDQEQDVWLRNFTLQETQQVGIAGAVNGVDTVGGIVGKSITSYVDYCYASVPVQATATTPMQGGLLAYLDGGEVTASFWDVSRGQELSAGGTPLSSNAMRSYASYHEQGWDFINETANGAEDVWGMDERGQNNGGLPFLAWQSMDHVTLPQIQANIAQLLSTQAQLEGAIDFAGYPEIVEHGFYWGTAQANTRVNLGTPGGATSFATTLDALEPNTQYVFQAFVQNALGDVFRSTLQSFTTHPVDPTQPAGEGTEASPYEIATLGNLLWIALDESRWAYHYLQTAAIDASPMQEANDGTGWSPIGTGVYDADAEDYAELSAFTGVYDGGGFAISNLYINRTTERQGLFGVVHEPAVIRNVQLLDANITSDDVVAALVGDNGGSVENCFASGSVTGNSITGGLVGGNAGSIKGSSSAVALTGGSIAGGLVGGNWAGTWGEGVILESYATGTVTAAGREIGGLVGTNDGSITKSYATGAMSASSGRSISHVGGLVGNNRGAINQSYASGAVTVSGRDIGGLVGVHNDGTISQSYATGAVSGSYDIGGLVGYISDGSISQSYAIGAVSGSYDIGGLVGYDLWGSTCTDNFFDTQTTGISISYCAEGLTTAQMTDAEYWEQTTWDFEDVWMIDGGNNGGYPYFQWQPVAPAIVLTQAQELGVNTANILVTLAVGNPVANELGLVYNTTGAPDADNGTVVPGTQVISASGDFVLSLSGLLPSTTYYVRAYAENTVGSAYGDEITITTLPIDIEIPAGEGTQEEPFEIATLGNLLWVTMDTTRWGYHYVQTQNIDAAATADWYGEQGWPAIGDAATPFTGSYNGNGHTISGLTIKKPGVASQGLFGVLSGAHVLALGLNGVNIQGGAGTGGISGRVLGGAVIENSYVKGTVTGASQTGGIAGLVDGTASMVFNSYSRTLVTAPASAGGLVGFLGRNAIVRNAYSTGAISGSGGGLLGSRATTGAIVDSSYWDMQASTMATSSGGVGKTTAQMKQMNTYFTAGWDFIAEQANGTNNVWGIDESGTDNDGYPFLAWEGLSHLPSSIVIATLPATNIASTYATLQGVFVSMDNSGVTEHGFLWKAADAITFTTVSLGANTEAGEFSALIEGLTVNEEYVFKAFYTSGTGDDIFGKEIRFVAEPYYTVTFLDKDGVELDEQLIAHGAAATAPVAPAVTGHDFAGWDEDFSEITSNLEVTAQYTLKQFTVSFMDRNGDLFEAQTVDYGTAAIAPELPVEAGFAFVGWDVAFDNITEAIQVSPLYEVQEYEVVFMNWNQAILKRETVEHGSAATPPATQPSRTGYTFVDWSEDYSEITSSLEIIAEYTVNEYTVTYVPGAYGTITGGTAVQSVAFGSASAAVTVVPAASHTFLGWDDFRVDNPRRDTVKTEEDITVRARYQIKTFTVVFQDFDGEILKEEQIVNYGASAVPPANPERPGSMFLDWSEDFDAVTENLVVMAQYDKIEFVVSFVEEDGQTLIGYTSVENGEFATAPAAPSKAGYTFTGWSPDVITTAITEDDMQFVAQYTPNFYSVVFLDDSDEVLETLENISHDSSVVDDAPAAPAKEGYTFSGWSVDLSSITSDVIAVAEYTINTYSVVFLDDSDEVLETLENVNHGSSVVDDAPAAPAKEGYTFSGWSVDLSSITSDVIAVAEYAMNTYSVVFLDDSDEVLETLDNVNHGSSVVDDAPAAPAKEGYTFSGWSEGLVSITSDLQVKAEYTINEYTVVFKDSDGKVIKEVTVVYGEEVTPPAAPVRKGYTFTGWDVALDEVTNDLTVKALYEKEETGNSVLLGVAGTNLQATYSGLHLYVSAHGLGQYTGSVVRFSILDSKGRVRITESTTITSGTMEYAIFAGNLTHGKYILQIQALGFGVRNITFTK
jgi:hypothetical protein